MSQYIYKRHNVSVLLYHLVFSAKYHRVVFDATVDNVLKEVCLHISNCYQLNFVEIGTDKDYVNFLVQPVPTYRVTKIVTLVESLTAREIFKCCPHVKKETIGRRVLDGWVFCLHCRKTWRRSTKCSLCKKSRERISG